MSAVILGNMVFWDIPCSLIVPSLKDPLMLGHHVIMMCVGSFEYAQDTLIPYCIELHVPEVAYIPE